MSPLRSNIDTCNDACSNYEVNDLNFTIQSTLVLNHLNVYFICFSMLKYLILTMPYMMRYTSCIKSINIDR